MLWSSHAFAPDFPVRLPSGASGLTHRCSAVFLLLTVFCPGLLFLQVSSGEYGLPSLHISSNLLEVISQEVQTSPQTVRRAVGGGQEARLCAVLRTKCELSISELATLLPPPGFQSRKPPSWEIVIKILDQTEQKAAPEAPFWKI